MTLKGKQNHYNVKFLKGSVKASGFSLENKLSGTLIKKQYSIRREGSFYDKDEQKGRSVDIIARKHFPDDIYFKGNALRVLAQIALIVECKNIVGNIWVFSLDDEPKLLLPDHASMKFNAGDPAMNISPIDNFVNIPFVSGYDEYIFQKSKSNNKDTNLYTAIMTAIKATAHQRDTSEEMYQKLKHWKPKTQNFMVIMTFFQPIIVFTGKMYVIRYDKNGEPEFEEVKYVQMDKNYVSKEYDELGGSIHIVRYDAIDEYLEMMEKYYKSNEDKLLKYQNTFLKELNLVTDKT